MYRNFFKLKGFEKVHIRTLWELIRMRKQGILTYIASSSAKGVKFADEPNTWYNPFAEIKDQVKDSMLNKEVVINVVDKNKFDSIELYTPPKGEELKVTEEDIVANEEVDIDDLEEIDDPQEAKPSITSPEEKGFKDLVYNDSDTMFVPPFFLGTKYTREVFTEMNQKACKVDKKNNLNYISWADAWESLKKLHPTANYKVYENHNGMPYVSNENGAFVKVGVTVLGVEHVVYLPVMDNRNQAVKNPDVVIVNKAIQRAFAKAIAMHGMGLYVYRGEDIPEEN